MTTNDLSNRLMFRISPRLLRFAVPVALGVAVGLGGGGCGSEDAPGGAPAAGGAGGTAPDDSGRGGSDASAGGSGVGQGGGGASSGSALGGAAGAAAAAGASGVAGAGGGPVCSPGDTRECVGKGACKGGQLCDDAGAWSTCDCGGDQGGSGGAGGAGGTAGSGGSPSKTGSCEVPEDALICTYECGVALAPACPHPLEGPAVPPDYPAELEISGDVTIVVSSREDLPGVKRCTAAFSRLLRFKKGDTYQVAVNPPWKVRRNTQTGCSQSPCSVYSMEAVVYIEANNMLEDAPLGIIKVKKAEDCD